MVIALLDADIICYRATVVAQEDVDWGDGQEGYTVNTKNAIANARSMTKQWAAMVGKNAKPVLCFSCADQNYFRKDIGPYKESRGSKPIAYHAAVRALSEEFEVLRWNRMEADDVMGIIGSSPKLSSVVVTIDKDLKTVPCNLLNPIKQKRPVRIKEWEADRFWMTQALIGDRVDGYPGCPGVGPVGADKVLKDCRTLADLWAAVRDTFIDKGLTEADALVQTQLSRILRRPDYDKDKEIITLWHPNSSQARRILISAASPQLASTPPRAGRAKAKSETPSSKSSASKDSSSRPRSSRCSGRSRNMQDLGRKRSKRRSKAT